MFPTNTYYRIKPLVPWRIRLFLRRQLAARQRLRAKDVWPILPGSECPPAGWPGWPEGKKFALVLTHDVESQAGVDNCRQLMKLEMKLGFRSSFNFVPNGSYRVSRELRNELTGNGFEVGVHDLHHDGKLYRSRKEFTRKALKINDYMKEWNSVGFRSAFMLHNLNWLHELDIRYDASTFDTDPFEPQPDGVGTIFPFWVPANGVGTPSSGLRSQSTRPGYVELPYTLPQDSTLFLLLRESSPAIWIQKLDWLAAHGGMALVNTHPDYMALNGTTPSRFNYPARFYEQFLEHIAADHGGAYWPALPRQVADNYVNEVLKNGPMTSAPKAILNMNSTQNINRS